ncbi:hypothetical protein LTR78_000713 [Recurvomyces mirabilis]|uniref:Heterokaryon incompatibility domain-containing protein n=1 Tax=Recurvomyces mirabilis TaxID=574656 RepID=A0AAE0WW96_9PEZI|nr:hypothetical protein LTR78_000713 [Recurvomyces mirabilis]KAK5158683.1 hypothetical protein LTS14_002791 [Recurvomyces mirabilis]
MRLQDHPRVLWIDAVCINQDVVLERNEQVALMGRIYSQSSGNLVHLGDYDEDDMSERMVRMLDALYGDAEEDTDHFRNLDDMLLHKPQTDIAFEIDWVAIRKAAAIPWFRRLWVVQEAALAPRNMVYVGSYCTSLFEVLVALVWFRPLVREKAEISMDEAAGV